MEQIVEDSETDDTQEVLYCCLFDFPRHILELIGIVSRLIEDISYAIVEGKLANGCIEDIIVKRLVLLARSSCGCREPSHALGVGEEESRRESAIAKGKCRL